MKAESGTQAPSIHSCTLCEFSSDDPAAAAEHVANEHPEGLEDVRCRVCGPVYAAKHMEAMENHLKASLMIYDKMKKSIICTQTNFIESEVSLT